MRFHTAIFVFGCFFNLNAQVIYPYRTCASPRELPEFSGIAKIDKNLLAAVNDGGNTPTVFFMDTTGNIVRKKTFTTVTNIDWEELSYSNGILNICDVGDNLNSRKESVIYFYDVKKDSLTGSKRIHFNEKSTLPLPRNKKHFDCEASFALGDKIWLFSKTHASPYSGKCYQYNILKNDKKINYSATDSAVFGTRGFIYNSITGAALSPKNMVAFLSCTHVWFKFSFFDEVSFFRNVTLDFDFDGITQKEAITFTGDYKFVVADERTAKMMGGRMYFFDLRPYITGNKKYTKPVVKSAFVKYVPGTGFEFNASFLQPAKKLTVFFFDKDANCIFFREITPVQKSKTVVAFSWADKNLHNASKAYGFWIVDGNQVIFIDKIRKVK